LETPFTTGAIQQDARFWREYIASRPSPSEDFFHVIQEYHSSHGDPTTALAHDGTPGFAFHQRAAEALVSQLDNIALPSREWEHVVRYKWNPDVPLLFNSKDGYDFDFEPVDRRESGEVTNEIHDRTWWQDEWDADRIKAYLDSVYPSYIDKAGSRYAEIEQGIEEFREALKGFGGKATVSFPVVLILATKK
ncbi:hypothetical protein N657DRAFT_534399, partial [Parathielavia appendiculata]